MGHLVGRQLGVGGGVAGRGLSQRQERVAGGGGREEPYHGSDGLGHCEVGHEDHAAGARHDRLDAQVAG